MEGALPTKAVHIFNLSNDDFLARVELLTKMAESTRRLNRQKIRGLISKGIRINELLTGTPENAWNVIAHSGLTTKDITTVGYMRTLLTVGYIERMTRATYETQYDLWREYVNKKSSAVSRAHYQSKLDDESKNISLAEIKRRVLAAPVELHLEKLIVAMYTFIPPCRLDYGIARVHVKDPGDCLTGNHVIIGGRRPRVILNMYKTSKQYGQIVNDIPIELLELIVASLHEDPRPYLLTHIPKDPYPSSAIANASEAVIGVRLACNDFRRIFASSIDVAKLTNKEHSEFARKMGHSAMTSFQKYRQVDRKVESG